MRMKLMATVRREDGMSTAEYAVGTVAVAGLGGILAKLLTSGWIENLLMKVIEYAFRLFFG